MAASEISEEYLTGLLRDAGAIWGAEQRRGSPGLGWLACITAAIAERRDIPHCMRDVFYEAAFALWSRRRREANAERKANIRRVDEARKMPLGKWA